MSNAPQTVIDATSIFAMNKRYLRNTFDKFNRCIQAGGSAITQNFVPGAPLAFNVPTAPDAYLEGIWVYVSLVVNPATGTGAAYAHNAGSPLNVFDSIYVNYNGRHQEFRPHNLRTMAMLSGFQALPVPSQVIAGQTVSYVSAYMNSGGSGAMPLSVATDNAWNFGFYVPMNWSGPYDARGMLPIEAGETTAQIVLNCTQSFNGVDPINNVVAYGAGTGHAIRGAGGTGTAPSGTVYCVAKYRDGDSFLGPGKLPLQIEGIGTAQVARENPYSLTGVGIGTVARAKIGLRGQHRLILATIVDGNQSNKFCSLSNLSVMELSRDANGNSPFWRFGSLTNVPVQLFFANLRQLPGGQAPIGQDIDEGIIPVFNGLSYGEADASGAGNSSAYVNTSPVDGYSDLHFGVQLGSTGGVVGIQPRIELQEWFLTDQSLQRVG